MSYERNILKPTKVEIKALKLSEFGDMSIANF